VAALRIRIETLPTALAAALVETPWLNVATAPVRTVNAVEVCNRLGIVPQYPIVTVEGPSEIVTVAGPLAIVIAVAQIVVGQ